MDDGYEVLFVDDEYNNWLPALTPVADAMGFHLLPAENVEEALTLARRYSGIIDAVILDLAFPSGQMQGKDGLTLLKRDDPFLPVLILTSSGAAEDIRGAVECVQLGAFDYFPKNTLDTQHLFLQVRNAIEQSYGYRRYFNLTERWSNRKNRPYVLVSRIKDRRDARYVATFAFHLDAVAAPRNEEEQKAAVEAASAWHHDLLNSLTLSDPSTKLTIRLFHSPSQDQPRLIDVSLITEVRASTHTRVLRKAEDLWRQLVIYLQPANIQIPSVYHFREIDNRQDLEKAHHPLASMSSIEIVRNTATFHESNIGFSQETHDADKAAHEPLALPLPLPNTAVHHLADSVRQMLNQDIATAVDVVLYPARLRRQEMDILRKAGDYKIVSPLDMTADQAEKVIAHCNYIYRHASHCFLTRIFVAQEAKRVSPGLISSISSDLFGDSSPVHVQNGSPEDDTASTLTEDQRLRHVCTFDEGAKIFHFPLPTIVPLGTTPMHPVTEYVPENLPQKGPILGVKYSMDGVHPVRIHPEDLRRHVYILGQTGTGKSTLLYSMIRERIETGAGVGLIDPHGDLFDKVFRSIPAHRLKDLIVFDPADLSGSLALNLLEYDPAYPAQKSRLISDLMSIFDMLYDLKTTGGPIFMQYMTNAMLLVMSDPEEPGTILDVVRVFGDREYRKSLLESCKDELVVGFWNSAERTGGEISLQNIVPYITSKLSEFIYNDYIRPIVTQKRTSFQLRNIIDEKKILLVRLTKGKLGDSGLRLLGAVLFSKLLMTALSREDISEESRTDFTLFVDEFQNFTSNAIASMLSEARKYRLNLVLANQTLGQIEEKILRAVLGNVGNLVFFRPGEIDMEKIAPYLCPPFERSEVLNLGNHSAIARLQINNTPTRPFVFRTMRHDS